MATCAIFPVVALVVAAVPCARAVAGPLFAAQKLPAGNSPFSVTVADFNGDGALDLAVANSASGDVSVLLGDGTGVFTGPVTFTAGNGARSIAAGDFDGDGDVDLFVAAFNDDVVSVLWGTGTGAFATPTLFPVGDGPRCVISADFDGDGDLDLAVANRFSDDVTILLGDGAGGLQGQSTIGAGDSPRSIAGGVDSYTRALAVFDDGTGAALYLGGDFSVAGGVEAFDIAKWDGAAWSPVGGGVVEVDANSWVPDLLVFDDGSGAGPALYVSGRFELAGEVEAHNIARWDGAEWTPLGAGLGSTGMAMTGLNDGTPGAILFAGGFFQEAGEVDAERVAAWSGAAWSAVTRPPAFSHTSAVLHDLKVFDDGLGEAPALYVAGVLGEAGGVQSRGVARYDGHSWSSPDGGVGGGTVIVRALEVFDDGSGPGLYVGGAFETAGNDEIAAGNIARWDGRQWSPLGGGVAGIGINEGVTALSASDGGFGGAPALYVGGAFTEVDGIAANLVARWDGQAWSALGSGIDPCDSSVLAVLVVDQPSAIGPAMYVGGNFHEAGGVSVHSIARWDGEQWSALGEGVFGVVRALAVYDDGRGPALYAAGNFQTAGGVTAERIARFNGVQWSSVGGVADGEIFDLEVLEAPFDDGEVLYAGGLFSLAGGVGANSVARYNGAFWTPLGEGVGTFFQPVRAVTGFDDGLGDGTALFAGGSFTTAGGIPSARIAKWTGCARDELPSFMPCEYQPQTISGTPVGINDAGVISGFEQVSTFALARAFIWTPESGQEFLEMPPNVRESWANDVNNAGVIAGSLDFDDDDLAFLAMRYEAGTAVSLGTLPGGVVSSGATAS